MMDVVPMAHAARMPQAAGHLQDRAPRAPARNRVAAWVTVCVFLALTTCAMVLLAPLPAPPRDRSTRPSDPSPADILVRRLRDLETAGGDPEQALVLHTSAGHIYRDQGQYTEAIRHYEAARELATRLGGGTRLVPALLELGFARYRQGRLLEARHDLESAFVLVGSNREHKISVLQTLGNVHRDLGHIGEALKLYHQAWQEIAADARTHAEQQASLASDMGDAYARRGDFDKAISYLQRALKQQEAMTQRLRQGPLATAADPVVALTYCLMGGAYHMRGNVLKAVEFYQKGLRMQVKVLRPGHTDLVGTQISLSRAERDLGNAKVALARIEEVESTLRGWEGPDLSRALVLKADLFREGKRYAEAESTIKRALKLQIEAFGDELNPEVAVALNSYASILHDQGKLTEARAQYHKAVDVNIQTVGLEHPETAAAYNNLGTLYQDAGQNDQALIHFTKCLEIQMKTVGNKSPDVGNTYNNLATILYRQGSLEDAAQLFRQALQVMDNAGIPKTNPDRAVYADNLAMILEELTAPSTSPPPLATKDAPWQRATMVMA